MSGAQAPCRVSRPKHRLSDWGIAPKRDPRNSTGNAEPAKHVWQPGRKHGTSVLGHRTNASRVCSFGSTLQSPRSLNQAKVEQVDAAPELVGTFSQTHVGPGQRFVAREASYIYCCFKRTYHLQHQIKSEVLKARGRSGPVFGTYTTVVVGPLPLRFEHPRGRFWTEVSLRRRGRQRTW